MHDTRLAHVNFDHLVLSLYVNVLYHRHVEHVYQFQGPFISRMDILPLTMDPDEDEDE